ncbi:hypothetical protein Scep_028921 [Stephania cephalantha]|uniref:DOMON domain-containing protein n=1 Tax=Stephania cephalantha TaxID=152367 RepID=A0AAP0EAW0_9MAGN
MATALRPSLTISIFCILASLFRSSNADTCKNYTFPNHRMFHSCIDLPYLSGHLHWTYIPTSKTIDVAYRAKQASTGWIAWGINPTAEGMVGTQALIGFQRSNGQMTAYTTPITNYMPSVQPGSLSFPVSNISAVIVKNEMIIFAVLGPWNGSTAVNHTWQEGPLSGDVPRAHSEEGSNINSFGTIDFLSG